MPEPNPYEPPCQSSETDGMDEATNANATTAGHDAPFDSPSLVRIVLSALLAVTVFVLGTLEAASPLPAGCVAILVFFLVVCEDGS